MSNLYNLEFYEKMLRQNSKHAELISQIRWDFIKELAPRVVLDFGSGAGFFRAFRPEGIEVDTYDIGPLYPQTGIRHERYDVVCFWDVLEHMPNLHEVRPYMQISKHVVCTTPILRPDTDLRTWRHFKPEEHLHYFNEAQLDTIFDYYGFKKLKSGYVECPPRQDVLSSLYKNLGVD